MAIQVAPSILEYLTDLEDAVSEIANTWRPDDPEYRADVYRQIMMNLSYSYFALFHADAEHPDWSPLWNPVYTMQPNPDDIYLYCPIRGDLTYRISGNRGTVGFLMFSIQNGLPGFVSEIDTMTINPSEFDHRDLEIGPDGEFEVLLSNERPAGHSGNWRPISLDADSIIIRYRSIDWEKERDPQLSIECLDPVRLKPRLSPEETIERIRGMAKFPFGMAKIFYGMQNGIRERVGVNVFEPTQYPGGLQKQIYWPAVYEFEDGEALIIETDMPKTWVYWNIQLDDPYYNAVEYVYRLSSINSATGKISSDGKLRVIISLEDPGVPNWLDTAGFRQGTVYGRWFDCDSHPLPTLKRVPLSEVRNHLPADTPVVTPEKRAEQLRRRVRAAQRRRRW